MAVEEVIHLPFWAQLSSVQVYLALPLPNVGAEIPNAEIAASPYSIGMSITFLPRRTNWPKNEIALRTGFVDDDEKHATQRLICVGFFELRSRRHERNFRKGER